MKIMTLVLAVAAVVPAAPRQQTPGTQKIEVVAVTGCLKQQGTANDWILVNATDPVASRAGTPLPAELPKEPVFGKNQFKLIGVSEFNLPDKKDKTVVVKGLFLKSSPVSRLNITSVTVVSDSCPAK
jgi:hypothetical protein